jgi:DNA-binding IclR family transcriptional regulator
MSKVPSLGKSLSVLEAVFRNTGGIGTRALAQQLDLNVATVHNIAMTFCERGYLRQDPTTKKFLPGMHLLLLGRHPSYFDSLTASASGIIDALAARLNESVQLSSIDRTQIRNLKYVLSKQALRVDQPDDISHNSYCTGSGKVLLASMSEQDLENYLKETKFQQFTPKTICSPDALRAELEMVRQNGYAQTCDEYFEGVSAVAVPIYDPWGSVIASLGASAPTVRLQKEGQFEESLLALREAASAIEGIWSEAMHATSPKDADAEKKVTRSTPKI